MRMPSRSGAALFRAKRSASPVIPPAARSASRTREPAGSRTTPGCATAPTTSTTMAGGVAAGVGSTTASTVGGSSCGRAAKAMPAPARPTTGTRMTSQRRTTPDDAHAVEAATSGPFGPHAGSDGTPMDRRPAEWAGRRDLIRPAAGLWRGHLADRDRQAARGLAVDLEVEAVGAVRREAQVVQLHDDVHVLAGDRVHRDLRRVRHRLAAVRLPQSHDDGVGAGVEPEDRDEEHPRVLRRQPGDADVPEHAEDAHLAVLADEGVIAQRGQADLRLRHRSVTMLTSLPGTTITFATRFPPSAALTFGLASAACFRASSAAPAGSSRRSRTLPSTWTTRVMATSRAASGSKAGQVWAWTEPWPPRRCHSSSAMCGANGASSRMSASVAASRLGPLAWKIAVESSINAAIAVLK